MISSPYKINIQSLAGWQISDQPAKNEKNDSLKYHIKNQDYFGTLATVLDLMDQISKTQIDQILKLETERSDKIQKIKEDLMSLQADYEISKKHKKGE